MASFNFDSLVFNLVNGNLSFTNGDSTSYKAVLTNGAATQDWLNRSQTSGIEVVGSEEKALTLTVTEVAATNKVTIDFSDITYASSSFSANGCIIYKDGGGALSTDLLVAYVDFGSTVSSTNGNFNVNFTDTLDISTT